MRKVKLPGVISLRKALPIWAMPKGSFLRGGGEDVEEVDEDALGGLGTQVDLVGGVLDGAEEGLEHEVEHTGVGELPAALGAAGAV